MTNRLRNFNLDEHGVHLPSDVMTTLIEERAELVCSYLDPYLDQNGDEKARTAISRLIDVTLEHGRELGIEQAMSPFCDQPVKTF